MKPIRVGVFGTQRGVAFMETTLANNGEVVALCDKNPKAYEGCLSRLPYKPALYTDFDEFIQHDMDAVIICNSFHEHVPFVIKALERGLHVMSECTSNSTMAEGVELVRAVEKSSSVYMLAENYPYMLFNQEMTRVAKGGTLGKIIYAEGEYNHPVDLDKPSIVGLWPYSTHWRNCCPRTYYLTHSIAPLMVATDAMPRRVTAMPVFAPNDEFECVNRMHSDRAAIITCLNDDDSVFKIVGSSAFGAHGNSYRLCGTKGQIENLRGMGDTIMLRYNDWEIPEGMQEVNQYVAEWPEDIREEASHSGHGGGDFFVIKEFFDCIRGLRKPYFDVYRATAMASVAILAHRSILNGNIPYDIPDFRKEEDRILYENDHETPFYYADGRQPTIPCGSHPEYQIPEEKRNTYLRRIGELE